MQFEKKQITKEDGRYLVFYHFPDTADPDQTGAFESVESFDAGAGSSPPAPAIAPVVVIVSNEEGIR